jgi:glycosyltransferase involved in cell wall biosynthesis
MESPDAFTKALDELDQALDFNPREGEHVCIGTPHLDQPGWNYTESLLRMIAYDKQHGDHLMHNSGLMNNGALAAVWGRSMELSHARNTATAAFLASDAEWLLWIDSDIGFEPDALEKLLAVADPETQPIVGALCFIEGDYTHDFHGGLRASLAPTLYDWAWVEPKSGGVGAYKMVTRHEWTAGEVTRVGATGCGMLLTHRSVYEKIAAWNQENGAPPYIWFERIPGPDGERCGEDVSFCIRAHQVGLPVHVHTGVTTTHQKTVWYGVPEYHQKPFTPPAIVSTPLSPEQWPTIRINPHAAEQAADDSPIRDKQVPEAQVPVAIIVPVAKRDNSELFLTSLADSLTPRQRELTRLYVMGDRSDSDTTIAWLSQVRDIPMMVDSHDYLRTMGSFAEKVNRGFEISDEPWILLVGDDVQFHRGWLDQAMATAAETNAQVVGTNDLGNPVVMAGAHATHMLIRRLYVQELGASLDGPGIVCHEGYRHWYVDNEIVELARKRDVWAPCLTSHVEHMHPLFGKGRVDDVYVVGQEAAETDKALWLTRFPRIVNMIENEGE